MNCEATFITKKLQFLSTLLTQIMSHILVSLYLICDGRRDRFIYVSERGSVKVTTREAIVYLKTCNYCDIVATSFSFHPPKKRDTIDKITSQKVLKLT